MARGLRVQLGLIGVACAHVFEAGLYAAGFEVGQAFGLGSFKEVDAPMTFMDTFYFSLVNYTSLGLGDIYPTGHLRFIAGAESLNGFLLISCSAAFLFMLMKKQSPQNNGN
ncbi:potassium channel family protein [Robiginitomaculum antarcticum]|uniref:potassium channel family protein n=1 Tax=Robiginitomaculum antarcticum TaxID=437507 RepID=UPI001F1DAFF3|nr:potassium channel family protein [Robiginitomaculum antarcticum]